MIGKREVLPTAYLAKDIVRRLIALRCVPMVPLVMLNGAYIVQRNGLTTQIAALAGPREIDI